MRIIDETKFITYKETLVNNQITHLLKASTAERHSNNYHLVNVYFIRDTILNALPRLPHLLPKTAI